MYSLIASSDPVTIFCHRPIQIHCSLSGSWKGFHLSLTKMTQKTPLEVFFFRPISVRFEDRFWSFCPCQTTWKSAFSVIFQKKYNYDRNRSEMTAAKRGLSSFPFAIWLDKTDPSSIQRSYFTNEGRNRPFRVQNTTVI
jgi:hypothetical protein